MRVLTLCLASLLGLSFGCDDHNHDAEPFGTLQACVDDHVNGAEGFAPDKAVTICCLDHPIGGAAVNTVCTDTQAGCEAYVDAQLDTIASAAQITAGCADYLVQRQN
ncbi:MAG: hypothetical protein IPQ07_22990 [Myxococcales bacterium]|nr:hypothetical protein [Myxococcales bacterium]